MTQPEISTALHHRRQQGLADYRVRTQLETDRRMERENSAQLQQHTDLTDKLSLMSSSTLPAILWNDLRGGFSGAGIVFELVRGSGNAWTEKILYTFRGLGGHDGAFPFGGVIFDAAGNLYGTTLSGGQTSNGGTVFELTPTTSEP